MWKVRNTHKLLLVTSCIIVIYVFYKPFHVPEPVQSSESLVNRKLHELKKLESVPKYLKTIERLPEIPAALAACPNVLTNMVQGYWKQNPMTPAQRAEIDHFHDALVRYEAVPPNFQRKDLRCGNVSYPEPYNKWVRAVCDQYGTTPCCYNNKCVSKTADQCKCDNCFDARTRIIAEYADWIPFDRRCTVKVYNQKDACDLLSDHTIVFIGDSMVRHVYIALLLLLQNNYVDGALKTITPKEIRKDCLNMEILTDKVCRNYIARDIRVCGGRVKLVMKEYKSLRNLNQTVEVIKHTTKSSKSLVFLGIGVFDDYNSTAVIDSYLRKIHSLFPNTKNNLLWATPNNYGILKADHYPQRKVDVLRFMKETDKYLKSVNIPQFNTYDMSTGVLSQDGHHYGLGLNKWKALVLLNYIQELKTKGQW